MENHRSNVLISFIIILAFCLPVVKFVGVWPKVVRGEEKASRRPPGDPSKFEKRYVFFRGNIGREADVNRLLRLMRRAAVIGYNGFVIGVRGYVNMEKQPPTRLIKNFTRITNEANELGLAIIPIVFDQRFPTRKDRNLAEAFPVIGTKFVVKGTSAHVEAEPQVELHDPGFENYVGHQPYNWKVDQPGKTTFIDTVEKHSGKASLKIKDPGVTNPQNGHARIHQKVSVAPFRAFELSVWIKTKNFNDPNNVKIYVSGGMGNDRLYSRKRNARERIDSTQEWTKYTINFNSLSHKEITVWVGAWSKKGRGEVWFDDVSLKEVGLKNMVRRSSIPITVRSWDGKKTYSEGSDYRVDEERLIITPNSRITDGQVLRVTWYQLAAVVHEVPEASACHQKFFDINADIAKRLNKLLSPSGFMMNYDEWRVANWDPKCGEISAGEYVAQTISRSEKVLRSINPNYELYIWNDMVDPYHNAVPDYWMVKGSLVGSWNGLSPDTIIVNWGKRKQEEKRSLKFFAGRGHRQMIAGYYESIENVKTWLDAVDQTEAEGVGGIIGFMYTTWRGNYEDLEEVANVIKERGRWSSGPTNYTE